MRKLAFLLALSNAAYPYERDYARSMVISTRGIVATSQTLASQAGAQILARGGSAADAAIAANAVLNVVEPMMNGMGGDLFAIVRDAKTGSLDGLNASGWAPAGLTPKFLRDRGEKSMPQFGIHSVTVPGCVEGWAQLHKKYGRLPWKELFAPAIYYASHGFPVTEIIQSDWAATAANISGIFLPGGKAPALGQVFKNEQLAAALKLVAEKGADAFYRGPIGDAILKTSAKLGGTMTAADLAEFKAEWVRPISTEYRGWTVYELPPNGQGMAALEMLNIMERFPLQKMDHASADALHHKIEAQKLAYADLQRYLADPKFSNVPWSGLISKAYAAERAKLIRARAATDVAPGTPPPSQGDTIYLSVVDRDGNIVSLIQSIYLAWGSRVAVEGMGFHLHNRGALFTLDETHPNVLAGRKRPLHTIIPGLMEKDGVHIGFGIMGGFNQAQAHAQFVSNVVDHGMNIQHALEAPRFTRPEFGGATPTIIENRYPAATLKALRAKGHKLNVVGAYASQVGGGQAVVFDSKTGTKYGASSPRKDGAAIPEPDPYF